MKLPLKDLPKRDHIAIMKRSWGLIPKILDGTKTCESRWYKSRIVPWDRIQPGDNLYFKDSGEPVTVKAKVKKVLQFEIEDSAHALEIIEKYAMRDLGIETVSESTKNYILNKRYAILIFFDSVEEIEPFAIDKTGFGSQAAWLTVDDINKIRCKSSRV
jgi:ASC-1-like (ASCH) protein